MKTKEFNDKFVPEVRILFSDLLYYGESQSIAKSYNRKVEISEKECINKAKQYEDAWKEKSKIILEGMQNLYELNFYKNIIDVYLAPLFVPKSAPLIINFRHTSDQFIDVLTHELFHNLFTDNQYFDKKALRESKIGYRWEDMFGKKDFVELVHIPVHSGLKEIYLDVLKEPYRLERDIKECQQWPAYKAAWAYVEDNDYKEINKKIKELYKSNF